MNDQSAANARNLYPDFFTASLTDSDPDLAASIKDEHGRQSHEIELIASWAAHGAPEGERESLLPRPQLPSHEWRLGEPDMVVAMPDGQKGFRVGQRGWAKVSAAPKSLGARLWRTVVRTFRFDI